MQQLYKAYPIDNSLLVNSVSDNLYSGNFGTATPTVGQNTIAGVRPVAATGKGQVTILGVFLRPSVAMDINIGVTSTDYSGANVALNPHFAGSGSAPALGFSAANAAPSYTTMRTYRAVPTTGIYISDLNITVFSPYHFVAVGATVNVGLDGWVTLYNGPRLDRPV
jgi:hypothetical protein